MMNLKERVHDKRVLKIIRNPKAIGINSKDLVMVIKEATLLYKNNIVACPDIIMIDKYNNINVIEYKSTYRAKGYEQLDRDVSALRAIPLKGRYHKILVWGNDLRHAYTY